MAAYGKLSQTFQCRSATISTSAFLREVEVTGSRYHFFGIVVDFVSFMKNTSERVTSREGINAVQAFFERNRCVFQEVAQQNDFGKDGYVDLGNGDGVVTNRLDFTGDSVAIFQLLLREIKELAPSAMTNFSPVISPVKLSASAYFRVLGQSPATCKLL